MEAKAESSDGLLLGGSAPSSFQFEMKARKFLAACGDSLVKAKFYMAFPTLMHFNAYKSTVQPPLQLTEEQMQHKIDQFISHSQETRQGKVDRSHKLAPKKRDFLLK